MSQQRHSLLVLAAAAIVTAALVGDAFAQSVSISRSPSMNVGVNTAPTV